MLLSEKSIEAVVGASQPAWTTGDRARREAAREVVRAAAKELGFDPLAPPLPRFAAGENVVSAAAIRVLQVPGLDKTLEKHRARVAACEATADRLAELEERRAQLRRVELGRMHDQITAGKEAGPTPAAAIAERQAIDAELALVGSADVRGWVSAPENGIILEAISNPRTLASVVFYGELAVERLRVLTEDEHYSSPAARTTQGAVHEVANLVHRFNIQPDSELYRVARAVQRTVEFADLHRLSEKHPSSVEELEAAAELRRETLKAAAGS